jgi:ribose-phosphate pyrophosphokinase
VAVTHGCLSDLGKGNLIDALVSGLFTRMFVSNTIKWKYGLSVLNNLVEVDVAPVFATAIQRIHNNESVSELFSV